MIPDVRRQGRNEQNGIPVDKAETRKTGLLTSDDKAETKKAGFLTLDDKT